MAQRRSGRLEAAAVGESNENNNSYAMNYN